MKTAITRHQDPEALTRLNDMMQQAGQAANEAGARHAFVDHTAREADNTIRRKIADLWGVTLAIISYPSLICREPKIGIIV